MLLDRFVIVRQALVHISSVVWMFIDTLHEMGDQMLRGRAPFRWPIFFEQTDRAGVGSVPLVSMVSFFLGLTMALLTGYQLATFGQERLVPGLVAISFTRELGPLITGIMVAARIGAAYTAELGTMTVVGGSRSDRSDGHRTAAFSGLAARVRDFSAHAVSVGRFESRGAGGRSVHFSIQFDISFPYFVDNVLESLLIRDIVAGAVKSFLFGLIIGLVVLLQRARGHGRRGRRRHLDHLERRHRDHDRDRFRHARQHRPRCTL